MAKKKKYTRLSASESHLEMLRLLAEQGGELFNFGNIPPEIEQEFVHQISTFHQKLKENTPVTIFDLIDKPKLPPAETLSEQKLAELVEELIRKLERKKVFFETISDVPASELYPFFTEFLFCQTLPNIQMKGWSTYLFYEDFLQGPENAIKVCAHILLSSLLHTEMTMALNLLTDPVSYQNQVLSHEEVNERANAFKNNWFQSKFEKLEITYIESSDDRNVLIGEALYRSKKNSRSKCSAGKFKVELHFELHAEAWLISNFSLQGLS